VAAVWRKGYRYHPSRVVAAKVNHRNVQKAQFISVKIAIGGWVAAAEPNQQRAVLKHLHIAH
jgi:hypothetical protein